MSRQAAVSRTVSSQPATVSRDSAETVGRQCGDDELSTRDSGDSARRLGHLRAIIGVLVYTVAALAFALSYLHTVAWVRKHSGGGWAPWATAALPEILVIVCLLIVKCMTLTRVGKAQVWGGLIVGYAVVITANAASAKDGVMGMIVALIPPAISFYLVTIKLTLMGDHVITDPLIESEPQAIINQPVITRPEPIPFTPAAMITRSTTKDDVIELIKESPEKYTRQHLQKEFNLSPATAGRYRRAAGVTS